MANTVESDDAFVTGISAMTPAERIDALLDVVTDTAPGWDRIRGHRETGRSLVETRAAEGHPHAQLVMRLREETQLAEEARRNGAYYDSAAGIVQALNRGDEDGAAR